MASASLPHTTDRLTGCGTALVTPFMRDGALDEPSLRALVEWQIGDGIDFLVPGGSTGEAATLSPDEHRRVVEIVVDAAAGRVPVVAGAGSNDSARAAAMSRVMRDAGATHLLHVSPIYNRPPQRGIVAHFERITDATELPVIVYNVPGRTGSNIEAATALQIARLPHVVGIKESSGDLPQIQAILRDRPDGFTVLSGDDALTLAVIASGGDGVISAVSNVTPGPMARMTAAALAGDFVSARVLHERLMPWMHAAFIESNPIPVKAALAMLGRMHNVLRLPLLPLDQKWEALVRDAVASGSVV